MGVDYYNCDLCNECVPCQTYQCKEEDHSICRYCVNENNLTLQAHYYDDIKKWVYEDYDENEHEGVDDFVIKDCSLCKDKEGENISMKGKIAEIVGKHCKRNKQQLCKELYDLLSLN